MQQLINPDGADYLIATLQRIDDKVCAKEHSSGKERGVGKEDKDSSVGGTMIKIDFPAFPLFDTHPGALKGKITHKMACQPDQQRWDRDIDEHWHEVVSP